jgi:hypothetical protein
MHEIFDGLATGAIAGLGSYNECGTWTEDNAATCTTEVAVKSGADKMLRCYAPVGAGSAACNADITTSIGQGNGVRYRFKMRIDQDLTGFSGGVLIVNSSGATVASVRFGYSTGLKIRFYDGTTTTNLMAAVKDTWYQIDMVVFPTSTIAAVASVWVDGVYVTSIATGARNISWPRIRAYCTNSAASGNLNVDIDDLCVYSAMPLGIQ